MISPELIRRCRFFSGLDDKHLQALAMVANLAQYQPGETIYANEQTSHEVYVLLAGSVELFMVVYDQNGLSKEFFLGHVEELDTFGLSSLSAPFTHTSTARAVTPVQVIRIDAQKLRWEIDADYRLGYLIMTNATTALLDRLQQTRLQLAESIEHLKRQGDGSLPSPGLFWFRPK